MDGKMPMSDGEDDDTKWLCSTCIGEAFLCQKVEDEGEETTCSYCDIEGQCFTITAVADLVEAALEQHYTRTSSEPDGFQYMMMRDKESDYDWEREGEETAVAIGYAAQLDEQPARVIQEILEGRYINYDDDSLESEFSSEAHYEEKSANGSEWMAVWLTFENELKKKSRFFSRDAAKTLAGIFEGIDTLKTGDGQPVVIDVGKECKIKAFYRARVFLNDAALLKGIEQPEKEIGPPPFKAAAAGRMNSRGISVFYGATTADVALSEVRPPVGSRVVVGRFDLTRQLRLLDLTSVKDIRINGSVFDPAFIRQVERAKFLDRLMFRMLAPVMPGDEVIDYLPTQVIAEYLASQINPPLDGIIYPSVQANDADERNVILFHHSSLVEKSDLPSGSKVRGSLYNSTEDGPDIDYSVFEEMPKSAEKDSDQGRQSYISDIAFDDDFHFGVRYDREASLHLDLRSLQVHQVKAVQLTTLHQGIRRYRSEAQDSSTLSF